VLDFFSTFVMSIAMDGNKIAPKGTFGELSNF
jgi:hypothetical protein